MDKQSKLKRIMLTELKDKVEDFSYYGSGGKKFNSRNHE
jgi:hypothetical protein